MGIKVETIDQMIEAAQQRYSELHQQFKYSQDVIKSHQEVCHKLNSESIELETRIQTLSEVRNMIVNEPVPVLPPDILSELPNEEVEDDGKA